MIFDQQQLQLYEREKNLQGAFIAGHYMILNVIGHTGQRPS